MFFQILRKKYLRVFYNFFFLILLPSNQVYDNNSYRNDGYCKYFLIIIISYLSTHNLNA